MTILVTGADGLLGSYLRRAAEGVRDTYLFAGRADLDITNREAVLSYFEQRAVDVVLNCAAYTDVDRAESEEAAAYAVNATAVGYLAEAAKQNNALIMHISTDFVFMGGCCAQLTEQAQPRPINAYGRTKLAGEEILQASGCHHMIIRTAWLYGAYGRNFVKRIYNRVKNGEALRVVDDQIGSPTYAADLAAALVHIVQERRFVEGIYHYTNLGSCSRWELAKAVSEEMQAPMRIQPCRSEEYPTPAQRPKNCVMDKWKFQQTFGEDIPHWRESLKRCIDELQA